MSEHLNHSAPEEIMGCCPRPKASFKAADVKMSTWCPPDKPANATVLPEKRRLDAQTKDAARNCEFVHGAIQHNVEAAVGDNLRIKPMPSREVLNLTPAQHWTFIQSIKQLFKLDTESKSKHVDITGHNSLTELAALHLRTYLTTGESLAAFYWRQEDDSAPFKTCVGLIDPGRLRTPDKLKTDVSSRVVAGIDYATDGHPLGYYIHDYHLNDPRRITNRESYEYVETRNALGREQIVHCYHQTSPELSRGVSQFACALRTIQKMEKYTDAQIESAIIQTMIAATIESDMPDVGDILDVGTEHHDANSRMAYMDEAISYHNENDFSFNGSKVVRLYDKEKLKINTPGKFSQNYESFSKSMWAGVARCFGLSLETLTQDWSNTSFSGARAGFLSMWRHIEWLRATVPADFAHKFYCVWLEEQLANGRLTIPGLTPVQAWLAFQENRDAFTAAKFFGSARDEIDREKTAKAYIAEDELGVFTLERYCNEVLGEDWCDVKEQQIIEELYCSDLRTQYGLPPEPPRERRPASDLVETDER